MRSDVHWPRLKPLAATIRAACLPAGLALSINPAIAGPEGGEVTGGQGTISTPDTNTTLINQQSTNLTIDWNSFNIAQEELVQFIQPSKTATALNRIYDQNPSQIFGTITANGNVILLNPNGIFFSPTAHVNVNALTASTLDISNEDFLAGNLTFKAPPGEEGGLIVNQGLIEAATGGSVNLIGGAVRNEGVILAHAGQVNLVAGNQVTIDFDGDGLMQFAIDKEILQNAQALDAAVSNTGEIQADGGSVLLAGSAAANVFSQVVNNEGVIQAGRIENEGGVIRLVGNGAGSSLINTGTLDASAADTNSDGGTIELVADNITSTGTLDASAVGGNGGFIELISADTTILEGNSKISATSAEGQGGTVHVLGNKAGLFDLASIDVSGAIGGGTVLVGGDFQGNNPDIQNAEVTFIGKDTTIKADATTDGDGGKVVVWADDTTRYYGDISAQGGSESGDGGLVEVSGHDVLVFDGYVSTLAPNGNTGRLLLDPTNVWIAANITNATMAAGTAFTDTSIGTNNTSGNPFTATGAVNDSFLSTAALLAAISGNNVTVSTVNAAGGGVGDIVIVDGFDIAENNNRTLTFRADNDIRFANAVTITDSNTMGSSTLMMQFGQGQTGANGGTLDLSNAVISGDFTTVNFTGGAGSGDKIIGGNVATTFSITGNDSGTIANANITNATASFTAVESLTGGSMNDVFNFTNGALSGTADGVTGTNTFTFTGGDANIIRGGGGASDVLDLSGAGGVTVTLDTTNSVSGGATITDFAGFENLTGAGSETLAGGTFYLVNSTNAGTVNMSINFSGFDTLVAATMTATTFTINGTMASILNLTGSSAGDIFNFSSGNVSGTASGGNGDDAFNLKGGSVNIVDGGGGTMDTLLATTATTFNLTMNNQGTATNVSTSWSNIENLAGSGANSDTFTFTSGTLDGTVSGGDGNDLFDFNGGTVSGLVDGETGTDTLDLAGAGGGHTVTVGATVGTTGSVAGGDLSSFKNITNFTGATTDTLAGGTQYSVTGTNDGTVNTATYTFTDFDTLVAATMTATTFSVTAGSIMDLTGSTMGDTFNFSGGNVSGTASGGNGDDAFNLKGGSVNIVDGGGGTMDTLLATTATTFNLTMNNQGTATNVSTSWSNIENLAGSGANSDTFTFTSGTLDGTVSGGDGNDLFDFNGGTVSGLVDGQTGNDTATWADVTGVTVTVGTDIASIETLVGGSMAASSTLIGANTMVTWTITGANSGTYSGATTIAFSSFGNLTGGNAVDTFDITSAFSGNISGGGGNDEFNIGANVTGVIAGDGGFDTFTIGNGAGLDDVGNLTINGGSPTGTQITTAPDMTTPMSVDMIGIVDNNAAETHTINYTGTLDGNINESGGNTINYTNIEYIEMSMGDGEDDLFHNFNQPGNAFTQLLYDGGMTAGETVTISGNIVNPVIDNSGAKGITGDNISQQRYLSVNSVVATIPASVNITDDNNQSNTFSIFINATGNLVVTSTLAVGGTMNLLSDAISNVLALSIDGGNLNDIFNLTFGTMTTNSRGDLNPIPDGGLTIIGGSGGSDVLVLNGSTLTFDIVTHNVDTATSGSIVLTDAVDVQAGMTITYNTLEGPIADNFIAVTRNFNYNFGAQTVTFADTGMTNDAINRLSSNNGISVDFLSPTATGVLNIDTGGTTTGSDTFTLNTLDTTFSVGTLNVTGSAQADIFNLNASPTGATLSNLMGDSGSDNFVFANGVTVSDVVGGADTDSLDFSAYTTTVAFLINSPGGGIVNTTMNTFSGIENLTGGAGNDIFAFDNNGTMTSGTLAGSIDGGAETTFDTIDIFLVDGANEVNTANGTISGLLTGGTFTDIEHFIGDNAMTSGDTISAAGTTFNITTTNAGCIGGTTACAGATYTFTGFPNLKGAAASNEIFSFNGTGNVTGTVDGVSGTTDTITWLNFGTNVTVDVNNLNNIDLVIGSTMNDTLIGADTMNTWTVSAANAGTLAGTFTLNYSSFESLTGGSQTDVFNLSSAITGTLSGGAGADVFNIVLGVSPTLIDGGPNGTMGTGDTINGANGTFINNWSITGADAGNVTHVTLLPNPTAPTTSISSIYSFTNVENLQGGTRDDTFNFVGTGSISGVVDGGAEVAADIINYSAFSSAVMVNVSGLNDIEQVIGSAFSDTLIGANTANIWNITALNAGCIGGTTACAGANFTFSSFENLTGGTFNDTFRLSSTGIISGSIAGGGITGGTADTLIGNNTFNSWNISQADGGKLFDFNGTHDFTGITHLTGGSVTDFFSLSMTGNISGLITGNGSADVLFRNNPLVTNWAITMTNAGTIMDANGTSAFTGIPTLAGTGTGANTFTFSGTGNLVGGPYGFDIFGGAGNTGTVVGNDINTSWTINALNGGFFVDANGTNTFNSIENLTGGSMVDTFNINANITGTVAGGDGNDIFHLNANIGAGVAGETGADVFNLNATAGLLNVVTIAGGIDGGTNPTGTGDILNGPNLRNNWTINNNSGTLTTFGSMTLTNAFSGIEDLGGGTQRDDFFFDSTMDSIGNIDGGGTPNFDILWYNYSGTVVVDLQNDTATNITGSFTNINTLVGNQLFNDNTTLIGEDNANLWTLNGATETVDTFNFLRVTNLQGGSAVDTFNLGADVTGFVKGGDGGDIFNFNVANVTVTGNVFGETGNDSFNINANVDTDLDGGTGSDTFTVTNAVLTGSMDGGAGDDGFNFIGTGRITGNVDGKAGTDNLNFSASTLETLITIVGAGMTDGLTGSVTDPVPAPTIDLIGGTFNNIDSFTGNNGAIQGPDAPTIWNISNTDTGFFGPNGTETAFANFALFGGNKTDTFNFTGTGKLTGPIDGGVNVTNATFTNPLNSITIGYNTNVTWTITGTDAGTITTLLPAGFTNISSTLTGGTGNDNFVFNAAGSLTGGIDGGGGTDTVNIALKAGANTIDLAATTATISGGFLTSFTDIEAYVGDNVADKLIASGTFNITNQNDGNIGGVISFTDIPNLTGDSGNNMFVFDRNGVTTFGALSGGITGGGGTTDTLSYANVTTSAVIVNLEPTALTGTFIGTGFSGINDFVGAAATSNIDLLFGPVAGATWNITMTDQGNVAGVTFAGFERLAGATSGAGSDVFNISADVTTLVFGGNGNDTFNLAAGVNIGNSTLSIFGIWGGSSVQTDIINGPNVNTSWQITAANMGNVDVGGGAIQFTNISTLQGGSADDTFISKNNVGAGGMFFDGGGEATSDTLSFDDPSNTNPVTLIATALNDIELAIGRTAAGDTLVGSGIADTFTLTGANSGNLSNGATTPLNLNFSKFDIMNGGGGSDTLIGQDAANIWNLTMGNAGCIGGTIACAGAATLYTSIENLTGGNNSDTFKLVGGGVAGTVDGGSGNDTLDYSDNPPAEVANVSLTGTGTIDGFLGSASGMGDFDNITNVLGDGNDVLQGIAGTSGTFTLAASLTMNSTYMSGGNTLNFSGIVAVNSRGTDTLSGGPFPGTVGVNGDATWTFTPGAKLSNSIVGGGTLSIDNGGSYSIGPGGLVLPTMTGFNGHLIIGGTTSSPTPGSMTTLSSPTDVNVNANVLTVTAPIVTGGNLTLMANTTIDIQSNMSAGGQGGGELTLLAGAGPGGTQGTGLITSSSGCAPFCEIEAGTGYFASGGKITNTEKMKLLFLNGTIEVATGIQTQSVSFAPGSEVSNPPSDTNEFKNILGLFAFKLNTVQVSISNPAADLIGLEELGFIDTGLFEEDLTLFGIIGYGIALALAQCEELEGCAPNVTEEELVELIAQLEARIEELTRRCDEGDEQACKLLEEFKTLLEQFRTYQAQLQEYLGGGDEEFEEDIEEDEFDEGTTADQIATLAKMLESINQRITWLEGLKADPEERARLSELTGIELTQEALDAIIEGARAEAQFIQDQIDLLQNGTEANAAPVFTAEARDYSQTLNITYGPSLLQFNNEQILALNERWY